MCNDSSLCSSVKYDLLYDASCLFGMRFARYLMSCSCNMQLLSFLSDIPSVRLIVVCNHET